MPEKPIRFALSATANSLLLVTATLWFATMSGCPARQAANHQGDSPKEQPGGNSSRPIRILAPSLNCLAHKDLNARAVPWDAALTLAEISNFAYSDSDEQRSQIEALGAKEVSPVVNGSSHGVVASNDDVVVIAFRGTTKDPADWLTDAGIMMRRVANGRMHAGFYDATDAIFNGAYDEAMRQGAERKAVWITGHSLGGAMAIAFAYHASNERNLVPAGIITFGQPLVVTTALAQELLDTFKFRYIRFVNNRDPVTRLIPTFRHAGARVHLMNDDFTLQEPRLAYGASANAVPDKSPHFVVFEDDENLKPMTEAELQDFEQRLRAERKPPRGPNGQLLVRASIPVLSDHYIAGYIGRLKSLGQKNWK
jgi:triacylglycerol lipase